MHFMEDQKMSEARKVLVTGAGGKLGKAICAALLKEGYQVRALQHKKPVPVAGVESVQGDITNMESLRLAVEGVDAVCHLATTKTDANFFDVSIRGTYNMLEVSHQYGKLKRFMLAGGDNVFGIWFRPNPLPIDENHNYMPYANCYAFSKVVEETMCAMYHSTWNLPYVNIRSSWIQTDDDILNHLTLGKGSWGYLSWDNYLKPEHRALMERGEQRIVIAVDRNGVPLRRHVVHIEDTVQGFLLGMKNPNAGGQSFNVAAPAPFAYDVIAECVSKRTGIPTIRLTVHDAYPFEINITKARQVLGYKPKYDIFGIIDRAFEFRAAKEKK
jgi:nucleoside-diphosphate-sugar epimerase